jgi:hypothetical protein
MFLVSYLFSSFNSSICFLNHSIVPSTSSIAFFYCIPFAEFTLLSRELGSKEMGVFFRSSSSLLFSFNSSSKLGTYVILHFPSLVAAVEIEFFEVAEANWNSLPVEPMLNLPVLSAIVDMECFASPDAFLCIPPCFLVESLSG